MREMTKPGVQLNINISSIILDRKHEFWPKSVSGKSSKDTHTCHISHYEIKSHRIQSI